jgi:hypothetical protein
MQKLKGSGVSFEGNIQNETNYAISPPYIYALFDCFHADRLHYG